MIIVQAVARAAIFYSATSMLANHDIGNASGAIPILQGEAHPLRFPEVERLEISLPPVKKRFVGDMPNFIAVPTPRY